MNLISDLQYFPSVIFYKISYLESHIVFDQYEYYQKMSFRNRALIAGANGIIILSVPLEEGRDQKRIMKEVRIANREKWQSQHWKSIQSAYNRSPWFEYYRDELSALYQKTFEFLLDWNLACFEWSLQKMELDLNFGLNDSYQPQYDPAVYIDWRNKILPKNYRQFGAVKYRQVFEEKLGFLPNLSILDLLFCEGKGAKNLFRQ
jgi:hypothetical protein